MGIGPFAIPDDTGAEAIVTDELLQLRVRARPFAVARATFTLLGDGGRCVVMLKSRDAEEEPIPRVLANLVRPVLDPMMHVRNHMSLERLSKVAVARTGMAPSGRELHSVQLSMSSCP